MTNFYFRIPDEILSKFYGCGCPVPVELKDSGLTVLDLGSGMWWCLPYFLTMQNIKARGAC